jgi:putative ABC transport system permease protein
MSYSLATLWYERQRFLPGILAVAFSALLMSLQFGLLLGLFSITSLPIDHTDADVWMGAPSVLSVDLGEPIREDAWTFLASQPEVDPNQVEIYLQGFAYWSKPQGGRELCMVIGSHLERDSLGRIDALTMDKADLLAQPGSVVVDESDLGRLGIKGVGDTAEVSGRKVRVVGLTTGVKSLAGPYVFCSLSTARALLRVLPDQVTYVLARCKNRANRDQLVERMRAELKQGKAKDEPGKFSIFTRDQFSFQSRWHWLTKTKAGIAIGYAAALGLLVGAVVTSQTLYAATIASAKEYAVLRALGIPRWRMAGMVLAQAFWVGVVGEALGLPALYLLAGIATSLGALVQLPGWLLILTAVVTMGMALLSGAAALRSLRQIEPGLLLR